MKTGRNDLCPCGSGKKYKKCCYRENVIPFPNKNDGISERLSEALLNLHKNILHKKPHIEEYNRYRRLHTEIMEKMVDYYLDGKYKQRIINDSFEKNENEKNLKLIGSDFNTETQENAQAFYDLLVYKNFPNMICITDDFIERNIYKNQDKLNFLQSMLNSKLGLYEITKTDQGNGQVYFKNVFTDEEVIITDMALSLQQNFDECYLYMRIISHNSINFGSGFILIIRKSDKFISNFIQEQKINYNPDDEIVRFFQLYKHYSNDEKRIRVAYSYK